MAKKTELRRNEISKQVLSEGKIRVKDLAIHYDVSTETIRKDIDHLERIGLVHKEHGAVTGISDYFQLPINAKLQENIEAKKLIARKALDLISDDTMIYLDTGSTSIQVAKLLRVKHSLTVLTNSITIAQIVSETSHDVIVIGGNLQKRGMACVGTYATDIIDSIHIDIAFLGSDGFKGFKGPATFSLEEAEIRKHIVKNSEKRILICDASKFNKTSNYLFGKFKEYDYLITDETDPEKLSQVEGVKRIISVKGD